jgi:hypothetical protein
MAEKKKEWVKTFRCPDEKWTAFQALCKEDGSTATQALIGYIDSCLVSGKVGAIGEVPIPNAVTLDDMAAAIGPLRDELAELREALGKSRAA